MKKEFIIREGGRVGNCSSNVAKMNVFEFIRYIDGWGLFSDIWETLREGATGLVMFLVSILATVFFPVILFIRAYTSIRRAKKEVAKYTKQNEDSNG